MEATTITAEWFTRYGTQHTGRVHDADLTKGTAKYTYQDKCSRCGGAGGSDKWAFTGWTCFECGGNGKGHIRTERLYSAERLAKLNATEAKRNAARLVKAQAAQEVRNAAQRVKYAEFKAAHPALVEVLTGHAERQQEGLEGVDTFLADLGNKLMEYGSLTDGQVAAAEKSIERTNARTAARAASQFVGEVGKRLVFTLTVEAVITLPCGCTGTRHFCFGVKRIFLCRDEHGNRITYKGTSDLGRKGDTIRVKATVTEHESYKDENQTKIARFKVLVEA